MNYLSLVNSVLRRLRETEVSSVADNAYSKLIGDFVNDAKRQVEDAYNKGGEWCNYGWSEGQMALFPTQKTTWDALQKGVKPCSGKPNMSCGRPGINGGIIKNPKVRFGINCYGKKPAPSDSDKALMKANVEIKRPESKEDADLKAKMKVWKENADKFLLVNSFNKTKWSEDV